MVLGLLLPAAFGLGVAARKPVPMVVNWPAEFTKTARLHAKSDWEATDIFTNAPVSLRALRQSHLDGHRAIALSAGPGFMKPDLLVYWAPGKSEAADKLPANAILLGTFNSPELPLPDEAIKTGGTIVLYSLADSEVVAESRQVRFNDSAK